MMLLEQPVRLGLRGIAPLDREAEEIGLLVRKAMTDEDARSALSRQG